MSDDQKLYVIAHRPLYEKEPWSPIHRTIEDRKKLPDYYKIGIAKDPENRMSMMSSGTPHELELVTTIECDDAKKVEGRLHGLYYYYRHNGEWFFLTSNMRNSLKGLDYLRASELMEVGLVENWISDSSLYVEVMKVRRNDD